jgi:hypothetical protein
MSESIPTSEPEVQEGARDLRGEFMNGQLPPEQFLDELFSKDQADITRSAAESNLAILSDSELATQMSEHPDVMDQYHNLASLSAFHVAQQKLEAGDVVGAIPFLEQSQSSAQKVGWGGYDGWKDYINATTAYARENKDEFLRILEKFPEGDQYRETLERLATGLKERGTFDYGTDY